MPSAIRAQAGNDGGVWGLAGGQSMELGSPWSSSAAVMTTGIWPSKSACLDEFGQHESPEKHRGEAGVEARGDIVEQDSDSGGQPLEFAGG